MADTKDTVRTDIKINAKEAVAQLRLMSQLAQSNEERIRKFSTVLIEMSREANIPLKQLLATFKQLNAEMSKNKEKNIFGNVGGKNIFAGAEGFLNAAQAADRFRVSSDGVVQSVRKANGQMDVVEKSTKKMGDGFEKAGKQAGGARHGIDLVRTALGTLAAVGIFQILNVISGVFREFIDNLRETELAIYNLVNAERRLSEQGIEVDPKGLQTIIDSVRELVPVLSQIQAEELVSRIATNVAPSLKLTTEQIKQMAEATALLYIRNKALGKSFDEVESQLTNAFLTGKVSVGINNLGVKINDQIVKDEALRMGLVKTADEFDNLTGEMEAQIKSAAMLSVVYKNATEDVGSIGDYMETTDAKISKLATVWDDFVTRAGIAFGPLIGAGLRILIYDLELMAKVLEKMKKPLQIVVATMAAFIKANEDVGSLLEKGFVGATAAFADRFKTEFDRIMESFTEFEDMADTPTAALEDLQNAADSIDMEKAEKELKDLLKTLEDLGEKIEKAERDFQTKLTRFDADALEDRSRLIEDYNLNVAQTLRQFALRRKELEDNYRKRELDDEAKFQEQLRQLREKFLYNLEDALRERDARQVLRLIDQYNMEKQALINENALKKKEDAERQRDELQDLKAQEQERLRVMAEEHALRLQRQDEDSALRRSRMLEDHAQEIADLKAQREEILKEAAAKIAEEYNLNAEGAKAIYDLLNKYYGGDGILQKLVAQGYQGMLNESVGFLSQLQQLIAYQQGLMAMSASMGSWGSATDPRGTPRPVSGGTTGGSSSRSRGSTSGKQGFASGGQFLATRPQSINVGEGGMPELVSVIPLSKLLGGSLGVNSSGGGGSNSSIEVAVTLSPDLEGRIISKTMDGVGDVVGRVNRSK